MEQTKHGISVKRRIYSFPMKGESRTEAICRSFRQYTLVDWAKYNKVSMRIVKFTPLRPRPVPPRRPAPIRRAA